MQKTAYELRISDWSSDVCSSDLKLRIEAPALGILAQLPRIDKRLRVDDERVRIGMHAWMQTDAAPLEARVAFRREDGNGRGYFIANQVALSAWSPLLHAAGVPVADGRGRIEAWTQLPGHRGAAVTADAQRQYIWDRTTVGKGRGVVVLRDIVQRRLS